MTAMTDIEKRTAAFAQTRTVVADIVATINEGIEALHKAHLKDLKAAVNKMAERHEQLKELIEGNPALFEKPRTVVFHGVKVGLAKGRGAIEWEDDERVCKAIKKLLPEQADILITTVEKPSKEALGQVPADMLKKLGVTVADAGDQVVIKPTDHGVDKVVKALLKGIAEEA
jgi:hypothetical protein